MLRLIASAAIPVCVLGAFALNVYADTTVENAKVVLSEEIIPHSPAPKADLQELGVEKSGASLYRIGRFYANHPVRWWRMAQRRIQEAFAYIPYGNFSKASGLGPGTQSQAFHTWSEFKKVHYPKNLTLLACLLLAYCLLAGARARWLDQGRSARLRTLVGPVLAAGCALEFIVSVTFDANGTAKHLFIFNVAVDLCVLLAAMGLAGSVARLWRRRVEAASTSAVQ